MAPKVIKSKGKWARTKGHSFERKIAGDLNKLYPEARRCLEYHQKDAQGIDLIHTGPYKIQCKRMAKYANPSRIEEVQCIEMLGDIPVLITKADKKRILAVIPYEEFVRLVGVSMGIDVTVDPDETAESGLKGA